MLVKHSLTQFNKELELLEEKKKLPQNSSGKAKDFLQIMIDQQYNIYQYLDQAVSD